VWGVYVRDDMRGRGLAQSVIKALLAVGRSRYAEFHLRVIGSNEAARAVYQRLGFRKTSVEQSLAADGATHEYEWWLFQPDER
jgi:predicted GNAT family acetyltransferase